MALQAKDASGATVNLKADGDGTSGNPFVPHHTVEQMLGGGFPIIVNPTINTGAYTTGMVVGGVLTLTNAIRVAGLSSELRSVSVRDAVNQKAGLKFMFFNGNPSAGTYTDHATPTVNSADMAKYLGSVEIPTTEYDAFGTYAEASVISGLDLTPASGADIYCICQAITGVTWASTSALGFIFGLVRE